MEKVKERYKVACTYSIVHNMRRDNFLTPQIESFLTEVPLEDLIAAKLELGLRRFGYPVINRKLWKVLPNVVVSSYLKYALSVCENLQHLEKYFGLSYGDVANYLRSGEFFRYVPKEERDKLTLLKKIVGIMRKGDRLPVVLMEEELAYRQQHSEEYEGEANEEDFNDSGSSCSV